MCYDCKNAQQARAATPSEQTGAHPHAPKTSSRPHAASETASRCSPTTKHVRLGKELKVIVMYDPISKPDASDSALSTHEALLALYDVLARYNAAIRVKYPPSAPLARVMERNTSGWANDSPCQVQEFKHAAEDAIHAQRAEDCSLSEGVTEILDAAQAWAGHTPIDDRGREVWHKRISIIERGLFDLVHARANAFFGSVWRLKLTGSSASSLVPEQQKFKRKLDTMEGTLKRARKDPEPTFAILLLMRAVVPAGCATRIVQYIA